MDAESVLTWVDTFVLTKTGKRLSDLQRTILRKVWQGCRYPEIAIDYGCTEGHVKDVSSDLWKLLSKHLGDRITKTTLKAALKRHLKTLVGTAPAPEDTSFLGRGGAIAHLNTLVSQGAKIIVIQGEGGLGKTTLAQQFLQTQGFDLILEVLMAKETQHITAAERIAEEWLREDFDQEPGVEFGVTLARLKRQLHDRRVGILIDNLEPALDQQGHLIANHRSYVELLRVLADARAVTLITSRDRLCESNLNLTHYRLPGLDQTAWQQFFRTTNPLLEKMHQAYGGNAKAMHLLYGAIQEDYAGNLETYWQTNQGELPITTDLKYLIASQVSRLQALDPQAYQLFCRLGCYRYQETLPLQGLLALLWDIPTDQHREIITSLRNRSLVEFQNGEYWLHPAIRAEAIAQLRASSEWEIVNRKAADFWTTIVQTIETTSDALRALEAYYHFIAIADYESAGQIILKSRNNQWKQYLPLGSTLYRMGLVQPVLSAVTQVLENVQTENHLSELYNILGDVRWITGDIHDAIACQEKTIAIASQIVPVTTHQRYYLKMLEVDSLLSIGLYKIDLWELESAAQLFRQVIDRAENTDHHRWAEKAYVCLALVCSYLGNHVDAKIFADQIYESLMNEQAGRVAYFMQLLGQTYINLGEFTPADELFRRALTVAEHYTQIKAKTLTGLAEIQRQQGQFETAIAHHQAAIDLLDGIGAKCDLAEASFQYGLTLRAMGQLQESGEYCDRARHLFAQMKAPKQVEKISSDRGG
jgi:tetratricopeptide (TPR) repeat protein